MSFLFLWLLKLKVLAKVYLNEEYFEFKFIFDFDKQKLYKFNIKKHKRYSPNIKTQLPVIFFATKC